MSDSPTLHLQHCLDRLHAGHSSELAEEVRQKESNLQLEKQQRRQAEYRLAENRLHQAHSHFGRHEEDLGLLCLVRIDRRGGARATQTSATAIWAAATVGLMSFSPSPLRGGGRSSSLPALPVAAGVFGDDGLLGELGRRHADALEAVRHDAVRRGE
jgi:hypothetical protein